MRFSLLLLSGLFAASLNASAQLTVSDFETPVLPGPDTAYINYDSSGQDVGRNSGLAHFPTIYDTSFGGYWVSGFAYSNIQDSVTAGFAGQYSARPGKAAFGNQYAVAYGAMNTIRLMGAAVGNGLSGMYVSNNNFAYYSMLNGDNFARKFGDTTGTNSGLPQGTFPDYFRMIFQPYRGGVPTTDSVVFYLADFRAPDSASDYIVKDWKWVSLTSLGRADSVLITLQSSDVGQFGMNTPAYFCIDNFTTNETNLSIQNNTSAALKIYPNPATEFLIVEAAGTAPQMFSVLDVSGKKVLQMEAGQKTVLPVGNLPSGAYLLLVEGKEGTATYRFVKP